MKICEKMMNKILSGEMTPEVEQHLQECKECRELFSLFKVVTDGKQAGLLPSDDLDNRIIAYAKNRKHPVKPTFEFSIFLRRAVMPLAAAVAVCFGLVYSYHERKLPERRIEFSYYDAEGVDTDLLMLSSQIGSSSANLTRVDAFASLNLTGDDIK